MHLFVKTLYMLSVMIGTAMVMLLLMLSAPDVEYNLRYSLHRSYIPKEVILPGWQSPDDEEEKNKVKNTNESITKKDFIKFVQDYTRPEYAPWISTKGCSTFRIAFAKLHTLPITAIASYPGSGNTWIRYLIQGATGIFTGSVYNDRQLYSLGFYGENLGPQCECTIGVKTHGYCLQGIPKNYIERISHIKLFNSTGILLIRNPYDAIISYRNFMIAGHTGFAHPSFFEGEDWEKFVVAQVKIWESFAKDWLENSRSLIVINYEELLLDPMEHLRKILKFLKVFSNPKRLKCVRLYSSSSFVRQTPKNVYYRVRDPFTKEHHGLIDSAVTRLNAVLQEYKKTQLPINFYNYRESYSSKELYRKGMTEDSVFKY